MADSSVPITAGAGTPIRVLTALGAGVAGQQVVTLGDSAGIVSAGMRADGALAVRNDPTTLLFDTFETLNTTNVWTLSGTVVPTGSGGNAVANPGTAANATSIAQSQASFIPGASSYLQFAALVTLEAAVITGATRYWGLAVPAGTPTTTVPIANGVTFTVRAADGLLYGEVYSSSALTQSVALTRPTDGLVHRYQLVYKASRVYFNIDNVEVASIAYPNTAVASLPSAFGTINGASILATATNLALSLIGVGDTGKNASALADGVYQWRRATVKQASTVAVAADTALVVAHHPSSPTPAGTNLIGSTKPAPSSTGTITTATPAATSGTLLAANANRLAWKVTNDSNVDVLVSESSAAASTTAYSYRVAAGGGYYEIATPNSVYTGLVTMLGVAAGTFTATAATSGAMRVTELT